MYDRLRVCLCHPKRIGMFYKDSFLKIIGFLVILFVATFGILTLRAYSTDYFSHTDSVNIASVLKVGDKSDLVYDSTTHKMTGNIYQLSAGNVGFNFMNGDGYKSNTLVVNLKESEVTVYYGQFKLSTKKYEDASYIKSFSIKNAQNGVTEDSIWLDQLLDFALEDASTAYAGIYLLKETLTILVYYLIVLAIAFVSSYFINPTIATKVRFKLTLYSTASFFFFTILSILFGYEWISYIAMLAPLIFSSVTFMHIIRVRK